MVSTSTYRTSDGTRVKKSIIDTRIRSAKKKLISDNHHHNCQGCGSSSDILDCSHTLSVNDCQNRGMSEQSYNVANLSLDCRDCHRIWESKPIQAKFTLANFDQRMNYLKNHCAEKFVSMLIAVGSVNKEKYYQLLHPHKDIEDYLNG